jgi:hypothetical protein
MARDAGPRPVALLVHEASVPYVRSVVDYVRHQLSLHVGDEPFYAECRDVAKVGVPARSVVFLVGDGFPRYARQPHCRYVFINFSLVRKMRWWKPISPVAAHWLQKKRHALLAKRDQYDMVLDFHPQQTRLLKEELGRSNVPVRTFMTGVADDAPSTRRTLSSRQWDVCFTGSESPRRARMRTLLETRGITVSPGTAPGLHKVLCDCRVIANVHFAACDTLEAPRIVHALSAGACLVTEPCYRLIDVAPEYCYVSVPYRRMPAEIVRLLNDTARIDAISRSAVEHIRTHYSVRAEASWRLLVHEALEL